MNYWTSNLSYVVLASSLGVVFSAHSMESSLQSSVIHDKSVQLIVMKAARNPNVSGIISVDLWNAKKGMRILSLETNSDYGFDPSPVLCSPDSYRILTCEGRVAHLWDIDTGRLLKPIKGYDGNICAAAFRPDGQIVFTLSDTGSAYLWNAWTGQMVMQLGSMYEISKVAFGSDRKTLLAGSRNGLAYLRDIETKKQHNLLEKLSRDEHPISVALSPNCKIAFVGYAKTAWLCDVATAKKLRMLEKYEDSGDAVFSADSETILNGSSGGIVHAWSVTTGKLVGTLVPPSYAIFFELVPVTDTSMLHAAVFTHDGKVIVITSFLSHGDHLVRLWDIEKDEIHTITSGIDAFLDYTQGVNLENDSQKECCIQ